MRIEDKFSFVFLFLSRALVHSMEVGRDIESFTISLVLTAILAVAIFSGVFILRILASAIFAFVCCFSMFLLYQGFASGALISIITIASIVAFSLSNLFMMISFLRKR